jgi:hypothetical protein
VVDVTRISADLVIQRAYNYYTPKTTTPAAMTTAIGASGNVSGPGVWETAVTLIPIWFGFHPIFKIEFGGVGDVYNQ